MQADPFDAMSKSYNALRGAAQDGAMNRAGRAYASGDVRGASNALAQGGMVGDAMALDQAQVRQQRQASEDDYKMAERRAEYLGQGVSYLMGVPYEQRPQALAALEPTLRPLVGDEVWSQIQTYDLSDQNLQAFGSAVEQEAGRLFQTRDGDIVQVDGQGRSTVVYDAPDRAPDAPQGYRWTADGSRLEAIPGGPSDTAVVASRAAAGRAPPRARSSGGGSSGGSSRSAAPARPAGRPWERFAR